MSDYTQEYFAAERTVRLDVYTPALSSALSSMQAFGQQRIDYATSRMRAILNNMMAEPRNWEDNPKLIDLLDREIVCPDISSFWAPYLYILQAATLLLVGELTVNGAVLQFHPLYRSFVKSLSTLRKESIEISDRLKEELLRPVADGDHTGIVADYKFDWWNEPVMFDDMIQFEEAFRYHCDHVSLIPNIGPKF